MLFVRALGVAQIDAGDLRVTPASVRKFALLLRLAADAGQRISRPTIHELVFPDLAERNARHSLRDLLYQFGQAGLEIIRDTDGVTLNRAHVRYDYDDLLEGRFPADTLKVAQAGLLPSYSPEHSEAFSEWLAAYRAQTTLRLCRALGKEITRAKSVGDWLATEQAARACLALEPAHEEATLALAETLAASGSKAQAVNLLDQYVRDLGPSRAQLHVSANVLRRRISERVVERYPSGLTLPFFGRDREMKSLGAQFDLARAGESRCVVIVGDAGIGKTRLAEEFCTQAILKGARVERVITQPQDAHRPMATFADLVPRLLELPGALGCSPQSMAALRRLTTHDLDMSLTMAGDVPREAVALGISRAIADLIESITAESTLILFVDDAQWADDLSRRALATLVSAKHDRRLLVVLASRDRNTAQYFAQRAERLLSISVTSLSPSSVNEILDRLLGSALVADDELCTWIAQSSGGNPFFLRCLVSHVQATGERFVVPSTISSLLDQQIAALGKEAFSVLSMCVVLGRHSSVDGIIDALEIPHLQLQIALRELEASHLLAYTADRIEPAHWLVAESVDRLVSPIALKLLHRRVALLLERDTSGDGSSKLWDCAEHWISAGEQALATRAIRACANYSVEIGRPREAAEMLLRAAQLIGGKNQVELFAESIRLADASGEIDLVFRASEAARSASVALDHDDVRLAVILANLALTDSIDKSVEEIRPWLRPETSSELRRRATLALLICADQASDFDLATEAITGLGSLECLAQSSDTTLLVLLLVYHSSFGSLAESARIARQILVLAMQKTPGSAADLQRKAAIALYRCGEIEVAREAFKAAYVNATTSGLSRLRSVIAIVLSGSYSETMEEDDAAHWLREAEAQSRDIPEFRMSVDYVTVCFERAFSRDDAIAARRCLETIGRAPGRHRSTRLRRWLNAAEVWLRGRPVDAAEARHVIGELVAKHHRGQENGDVADFELAVALRLCEPSEQQWAEQAVTKYLNQDRRGARPLSRPLQTSLNRLGIRPSGKLGESAAATT